MSSITAHFIIIFLISNIVLKTHSQATTDYCAVGCIEGIQTVCLRRDHCGPVGGCYSIPTTVQFRTDVLHYHNYFREKIASGQDGKNYGNTGATNMNALSYDLELEYIAACYVNSCPAMEHDVCRATKRWKVVGQCITGLSQKLENLTFVGVRAWYDEIEHMHNSLVGSFEFALRWGHFAEIMWADVVAVGCAQSYHKDPTDVPNWGHFQGFICNYGPGGNYIGKPIYEMAADPSQIGSKCKVKNDRYPSLCGKILPVPTDPAWAGTTMIRVPSLLVFVVTFGWISSKILRWN